MGIGQIIQNFKKAKSEEKEMGFLDHVEELRWHILRSAVFVLVFWVVIFCFKDFLFNTLLYGPKRGDFITYRWLCQLSPATCIQPKEFQLITRDLSEPLTTHLTLSFYIALLFGFPYILWEFWRFIKPGLRKIELEAGRGLIFICSTLFYCGVLFGYFAIAPMSINFLSGYDVGAVTSPTLSSYVSYMFMITIPVGLVFELPVLCWFLARIGILSTGFMKNYRRHSIVILVIIAAIISPPDVVTQMIILVPLLALYEASIFIVKKEEKKYLAKQEAAIIPYQEPEIQS